MGSLAPDAESAHSYIELGLSDSGRRQPGLPQVLPLLSSLLERTVQSNDPTAGHKDTITSFHGLRAPEISIHSYIKRLFNYSKCSPSCFILAHIYIDLYLLLPGVRLTCLNLHRLLLTSLVVAAKFIDDACFSNAYYARVGGVSTQEMNRLELDLLFSLDFRLQVPVSTFRRYCLQLENEATGCHVERPVRVCAREGWSKANVDDSNCQPALQRCSCGAQ